MTMSQHSHLVERAARQSRNPLLLNPGAPPLPVMPVMPVAIAEAADEAPPALIAGAIPAPRPPEREAIDIEALRRAGLAVFGSADRTRVMEEWRIVASTLLRQQPRRQADGGMGNTLMVTSSRAREGKSFCSLNLAATIASNRQAPTVLVDLDGKPNALSKLLGLADCPGLLDLMDQPSLPLADVLVPTAVPNLHFLPLGSRATSAARGNEAGVTFAFIAALERVARQLASRLLVFDTAPCLATGDAAALAPLVGQIAMVVEAEITQKEDIEAALNLMSTCQVISLVLNKARNHSSGHFGVEYYGYDSQGR